MKKFPVLMIVAFSILYTGCGLVQQNNDQLLCSLANNLYRTNDEIRLNYSDALALPPINTTDLAQSFVPSKKMEIDYADLLLQTIGNPNPAGTLTLSIQKDSGANYPDNINIASGFIQIAQLTSQVKSMRFAFPKVQLEEGKRYWLRLSSNIAPNGSNTVAWAGNSQNVYSQGEAKYLSGATWSNAALTGYFSGPAHDLVFSLDCKNNQ